MKLATGRRLGPYEVLGPIGAGGMGEVYRARDARLDRTIALTEPALHHYLMGRYFWAQRDAAALHRAMDEFVACAAGAPDFAPAHVGLADSAILLAMYGIEAPLAAALSALGMGATSAVNFIPQTGQLGAGRLMVRREARGDRREGLAFLPLLAYPLPPPIVAGLPRAHGRLPPILFRLPPSPPASRRSSIDTFSPPSVPSETGTQGYVPHV